MSNRIDNYLGWQEASSHYIRQYAYDNGDYIYRWMKNNGIGESAYGRLIDSFGQKPGVFYHRLHGHHPVYDFPISNPEDIPDFLEHIFISDFFTKQGLPVIPGEIMENNFVKQIFNDVGMDWNFVNAFDLLAGTLAIYNNYKITSQYWSGTASLDSLHEIAKILGVTTIHIALAFSSHNPLLLLSSLISVAGTLKGLLNNKQVIYFKKVGNSFSVTATTSSFDLDKITPSYAVNNVVGSYQLKNYLK